MQDPSVTAAPERTCVDLCSRTSPESAERTVAGSVSSERTRTEVALQVIRRIHTERKRKQKRTFSLMFAIFTARKRSLGQGNIFAPVCHSVHKGGSTWQAHPLTGTPHGQVHPLPALHAGIRSTSGILLECILVNFFFAIFRFSSI